MLDKLPFIRNDTGIKFMWDNNFQPNKQNFIMMPSMKLKLRSCLKMLNLFFYLLQLMSKQNKTSFYLIIMGEHYALFHISHYNH